MSVFTFGEELIGEFTYIKNIDEVRNHILIEGEEYSLYDEFIRILDGTEILFNLDAIPNGANYGKVALTSISEGKIIVAGLDSGVTDKMFTSPASKDNVEAWKHASDVTFIDGGKIYTGSITANEINVSDFFTFPSDEDLVGYWSFDEGSGILAVDGSGHDNNGSLENMEEADWVGGVVGKCLDFDGIAAYVLVTHDGSLMFKSGDFSVSLWVNPKTMDGYAGLITVDPTQDFTWKIAREAGDDFFKARFGSGVFRYPSVSVDEWHHYVYVKSGTTLTLYFDGEETASGTCPATHAIDGTELLFGSYRIDDGKAGNNMYNGLIDEARVYSHALTEEEIKALFLYPAGNKAVTISGGQIAANTITADKIVAGTITVNEIDFSPFLIGTHDAENVPESGSRKWAAESGADITGGHQAATILNQGDLAILDTIGATHIDSNAVTTPKLDALAVTAAKIAVGTITANKISVTDFFTFPSDEDLVGYWSFDESSGSLAVDGSDHGNNGELKNMDEADWVDGIVGKCLNFEGTNYIDCGQDASLNVNHITMSVWIKPDAQGSNDYLISKHVDENDTSFGLGITDESDKKLKYFIRAGGTTTTLTPSYTFALGEWHHIVITYDGTDILSYINGELIDSTPHSVGGNMETSTADLTIGRLEANYFDGLIDEVRIYSRALSENEIKALYLYPAGNKAVTISGGQIAVNTITSEEIAANIITTDRLIVGETGNTDETLDIWQGEGDTQIFRLRSSLVNHNIKQGGGEDYDWGTKTDCFYYMRKKTPTSGGVFAASFTEEAQAISYELYAIYGAGNKDKDGGAEGAINLSGLRGAPNPDPGEGTYQDCEHGDNIFVIKTKPAGGAYQAVFIIDEDGDILYDGSASSYQDYDDIVMLKDVEDILGSKISPWHMKRKEVFSKHKIVYVAEVDEVEIDENKTKKTGKKRLDRFISSKKMNMLFMGAIRQLNEKIESLEMRLDNN